MVWRVPNRRLKVKTRERLERVKKAKEVVGCFNSVQFDALRKLRGWPEYPYTLREKIKLLSEICQT